jgi:hypothetical protein
VLADSVVYVRIGGRCLRTRTISSELIVAVAGLYSATGAGPTTVDCYTIPLGGFDVVLGVEWLGMLGPLLWDFNKLLLTFWRHGRRITWRGEAKKTGTARAALCTGRNLLDELLLEYDSFFEMPKGLPPSRPCDHRIHLLPGAEPVVVRPYRYPAI